MRESHSIVERWPEALKLKPGEPGAKEEFLQLASSVVNTWTRYVEWKKFASRRAQDVEKALKMIEASVKIADDEAR
jgi:hypothetical protein